MVLAECHPTTYRDPDYVCPRHRYTRDICILMCLGFTIYKNDLYCDGLGPWVSSLDVTPVATVTDAAYVIVRRASTKPLSLNETFMFYRRGAITHDIT